MSESIFLKTVLFGGYDRTEVEKEFERLRTELFRVQSELADRKRIADEMQQGGSKNDTLQRIVEEQRTEIAQIKAERELSTAKVQSFESECKAKDHEIQSLKTKITSLKDKLHDKEMKLSAFEADEDTKPARAAIAEIEEKAHSILHSARKEASKLEENSKKLSENVIKDANNQAKRIVYDAQVESERILADAQNRCAEHDAAYGNLRTLLLADVEQMSAQMQAIQSSFEQFRSQSEQSIGNAVQLLSSTDQILKTGGTPVFKTPHIVQPKLPESPEYMSVSHSYPGPDESDDDQEQKNTELKRLQQMANAIAGVTLAPVQNSDPVPQETQEVNPPQPEISQNTSSSEPEKTSHTTASAAPIPIPDLAALAAQADAIVKGKRK